MSLLHFDKIAHCAKIVAKVQISCWSYTTNYCFHNDKNTLNSQADLPVSDFNFIPGLIKEVVLHHVV